ncbi:flagellar export chaperone FliS, partial [Halobacillus litoralis]
LLDGALERINMAKGKIEAKDYAAKGNLINKSMEIVAVLRGSLNFEEGGDLAGELERLYDYMERALLEASMRNDVEKLDEVAGLLRTVKEGWQGIREEALDFLRQRDAG